MGSIPAVGVLFPIFIITHNRVINNQVHFLNQVGQCHEEPSLFEHEPRAEPKCLFVVCLLLFYVLSTFNVISGLVLTSDSVHSWQLYSVPPLGDQTASIMT